MKKLLIHLKKYKKECILGPLFKLLEALFELIVPLIIAAIIDSGISNNDIPQIIKFVILLFVFAIVGFICAIAAQYFAAKAACGFAKEVKHALFSHIQQYSYSDLDSLGTSTLITRLTSDVNQLQTGVNLGLRLLLRSPFIVFGAAIMAFVVDAKSAVTFVIVIPILTIIVFAIILGCIPLYKKVQQKLDTILLKTRENLNGVRVLRAFRLEKKEAKEFVEANNELSKGQILVGKISALLNPITFIIINVFIISLIYVGAIRVDEGIITQGAVIALYNYMSQILVELIKLANLIVTLTKSIASGNRISDVLKTKSTIIAGEQTDLPNTDNIIEFKNVSFAYNNSSDPTINNVSFKAKVGSTIGIIGATGSGKTTLVNLINHSYYPTSGEILLNGININNISAQTINNTIGIVPQKATLFKGTIKTNLLWGNKDASDEDLYEALENAQATNIIDVKEDGLNSIVEQNGKNYSGGQKQRLTIARAMVKKPKILILDDSSSALDLATDAKLRKAINSLDYNPTIFLVSQRTSSIINADQILVLENGELIGNGTHAELLSSCEIYKEIYDSQFAEAKEAI